MLGKRVRLQPCCVPGMTHYEYTPQIRTQRDMGSKRVWFYFRNEANVCLFATCFEEVLYEYQVNFLE